MKKIFLTGASSGIGLAIAEQLCAEGHEVWGTSRDVKRIPAIAGLHPVTLDLADSAELRESFKAALAESGGFDVLINNAGSGHFDPAAAVSGAVLSRQFQILVLAQIELCQLALAALKKQNGGLIINVSSLAARLPVPFMSAYNAAKAAMAAYTMTLQVELRESNIHVVDLQPGDISTSFNDSVTRSGTDDPAIAGAWDVVERNMKEAPPPQLVARRVASLIRQKKPPRRVTVGSTFQTGVAPFIFRFLPQGIRVWGLKRYYRL